MINLEKATDDELNAIKQIIKLNVDKSELEKLYLFTKDTIEKSKIFIYCYRFLENLCKLMDETDIRKEIRIELEKLTPIYNEANYYVIEYEKTNFGKHKI